MFFISTPFCYDVTVKSIEVFGNCGGSAGKGCDSKIVLAGFYINLCTIHFYGLFAKYGSLAKHIASALGKWLWRAFSAKIWPKF